MLVTNRTSLMTRSRRRMSRNKLGINAESDLLNELHENWNAEQSVTRVE